MARHPGSAAIAAIVTFGLFYLMHSLSALRDVAMISDLAVHPPIVLADVPDDSAVTPKARPPSRPEQEAAPEPPLVQPVTLRPPDGTPIDAGLITPPQDRPTVNGAPDQPVVTLFCPPPNYPAGPERRQIGGWVHVRYDVNRAGGAENVRVVDSDPPRIFDRAAVRAAERCRFRPRQVDGRAVHTQDRDLVYSFDPTEQEDTR